MWKESIKRALKNPKKLLEMSHSEQQTVLLALGAWQTAIYGQDVWGKIFYRLDDAQRQTVKEWYESHRDKQPQEYYVALENFRNFANAWGNGDFNNWKEQERDHGRNGNGPCDDCLRSKEGCPTACNRLIDYINGEDNDY